MSQTIQSLWIGRALSLIEQLTIISFLKNGHEFHLYCYDHALGNVPPGAKVMDAAAILPATEVFHYQSGPGQGSVSAFSNLFRYKLLLEKGGWWTDMDVVCVRPFDVEPPVIIATEDAPNGETKAATAVIKLPARHEIARLCYEAARQADRRTLKWAQTGPDLLDRMVRAHGFASFMQPPGFFCPLPYWEWETLLAPPAHPPRLIERGETRSIHLWREMWRRKGVLPSGKKSGMGRVWQSLARSLGRAECPMDEENSVFAQLLRRYGLGG
jgi:hypothetical protein